MDLVRDPGWDVYDFDGIGSDRCRFRDFGDGGQEGGSRPPAVEGINGGKSIVDENWTFLFEETKDFLSIRTVSYEAAFYSIINKK